MSSIANHSILQGYNSGTAPQLSLPFFSVIETENSYRDTTATLLDLACKSVQDRRRKRTKTNSKPIATSLSTSPLFNRILSFQENSDINQVYSEIMMSSDDTPKASWIPSFQNQNSQRLPISLNLLAGPSSSSPSTTTSSSWSGLKRVQTTRKRASRQRPVSRGGPTVPTVAATALASVNDANGNRRHRSKVLTQALRKSKEMRGLQKSVDLKLVKPFPSTTTAYGGGIDEEEDEDDWAAFITSGYRQFPVPPTRIDFSPATSTTTAMTTGRSDSTFTSVCTSATSLSSSSQVPRTGIDWLDDELAWASSDEEIDMKARGAHVVSDDEDEEELQEIVQSPHDTVTRKSATNRFSGVSDIFCTPTSSPLIDSSPRTDSKPTSFPLSKLFQYETMQGNNFTSTTDDTADEEASNGDGQMAKDFQVQQESRDGAFEILVHSDRHGSVSSVASSEASSAVSKDFSSAESASTRRSSASTASSGSDCRKKSFCSPERPSISLPSSEAVVSRPRRSSQDKNTPITPTRMTSLYRCVEVVGEQSLEQRPLLGSWLTASDSQAVLPRVEAIDDGDCSSFADDNDDDNKKVQEPVKLKDAMLYSRSSSDLLRVMANDHHQRIPRRPSRTSILANCDEAERKISIQYGTEERTSMIYMSSHHPTSSSAEKGQGAAGKLRNRLAATINLATSRRSSTPDVPVTPSGSTESGVYQRSNLTSGRESPSDSIFGSAAINARASHYVTAAAAATIDSTCISPHSPTKNNNIRDGAATPMSWQQRRRVSSECSIRPSIVGKAGFCFDYNPASPFYTSGGMEDCQVSSPTSASRSPPPSSFWRKNNAKAHEAAAVTAADGVADEGNGAKFPTLRRRGSFKLWK